MQNETFGVKHCFCNLMKTSCNTNFIVFFYELNNHLSLKTVNMTHDERDKWPPNVEKHKRNGTYSKYFLCHLISICF